MTHILKTKFKFELGKSYKITKKNGNQDSYKVLEFYNPTMGRPAIKTKNLTYGWTCYIGIADIKEIS